MKVLTKEDIVAKIKAAESKYYKENPCFHCGPGNGCDDCRGCEDAKKSWELGNELSKAKKEYEQRFGHSYAQDCDYEQIVKNAVVILMMIVEIVKIGIKNSKYIIH